MRQSSIARLEAGEHNARLSTLIKIAEALEAKLEIRLVPVYYVEDDEEKKRITNSLSRPVRHLHLRARAGEPSAAKRGAPKWRKGI